MPNHSVMPRIRSWMLAHPDPATITEIARGAEVSAPSARTFMYQADERGELEVTGTPGRLRYRLLPSSPSSFEQLAAAGDAPLDEALTGLHRIANAAGIFEETCEARSIAEVCDMIARWCEIRRGLRLPERGFTAGQAQAAAGSPAAALKARLAGDPLAPPGIVLAAVRDAAAAQIAAGGPMWRLRCSVDIEQAHRFPGMLGVEVYRTWRPGRWQLLDAGGGVIATSGGEGPGIAEPWPGWSADARWPRGATVEFRAAEAIVAGQVVEDHLGMVRPWHGSGPALGRAVTGAACNEQIRVIIVGGES